MQVTQRIEVLQTQTVFLCRSIGLQFVLEHADRFPGVIIVQAFGIQVANKLQVLTVMSTVLRNHLSINNCFTEILEVNLFAFAF